MPAALRSIYLLQDPAHSIRLIGEGMPDDWQVGAWDGLAHWLAEAEEGSQLVLHPSLAQSQRLEAAAQALERGVRVGYLSANGVQTAPLAVLYFVLSAPTPAIPGRLYVPHLPDTILVTGAAGSIGQALVRTLLRQAPQSRLVLFDNAETPLVDLDRSLQAQGLNNYQVYPGDICDGQRLAQVQAQFAPQLVLHAAACKHVPLMEEHPYQARRVNVDGTQRLLDQFGDARFVFVSTDKAIQPTSYMGETKREAEQRVLAARAVGAQASLVRFGNVAGSNGSVIPYFRKLLRQGRPLPLTHPAISRYFISPAKASQTILYAAALAPEVAALTRQDSESVPIIQLAQVMQGLWQSPAPLQVTGMRPGEQVTEALLHPQLAHLRPDAYGCYHLTAPQAAL